MKLYLFIFSLMLFSCNNKKKSEKIDDSKNIDTIPGVVENGKDDKFISTTPLTQCYEWTVNKDSAYLKITYMDNAITGDLVYDWKEKDGNKGTIEGYVDNNLVVAWYTFQSEGITSVREVVFKVDGSKLIEGVGESVALTDTMKFKDKSKLEFFDDRPFEKINCK